MTSRTFQTINRSTRDDPAVEFSSNGFALFEAALPGDAFHAFSAAFLDLVRRKSGTRFDDLHAPALRERFEHDRELESGIYNAVRSLPELRRLAEGSPLILLLEQITPRVSYDLLGKMILRMDMPQWTHEVAHWHQDHHYVRGNHRIVTAWIPLQVVDDRNGCLLVAPGSHTRGAIAHDRTIGKRNCLAEDVIDSMQVISVPMRRGDVLLFDALLLHSGQVNRSESIRYSLQFRYSPVGMPVDPGMGAPIPLARRS